MPSTGAGMSCLTSYVDEKAFTPKTPEQWINIIKSLKYWF